MRQRLGVPANVAPNTRRTQFINHANYKIIYLNVIDWANATKIILPHLPNTISPPDEHAQCEDNVSTGNTFSPPEAALPLVLLTKRSAASGGREGREWGNYRKQEIFSKVIAGIAQRDGNVSFLFH